MSCINRDGHFLYTGWQSSDFQKQGTSIVANAVSVMLLFQQLNRYL